jgi:DNA-binding NtrC family response regulator
MAKRVLMVLVVEEERVTGLAIKQSVEKMGYQCLSVAPKNLLDNSLIDVCPDLVISETDWMTRLSLNAFMHTHHCTGKLPVIYLHGGAVSDLPELKTVGTLNKPFEFTRLQEMVKTFFKEAKLNRA